MRLGMRPNTMVFKHPGMHPMHGDCFDYQIVDDDDLEAALADGWSLTTTAAKEASQAKKEPAQDEAPIRAELEQKARELGIKFDGRTNDRKLGELIAAKLE